jgi:hypothetical protein
VLKLQATARVTTPNAKWYALLGPKFTLPRKVYSPLRPSLPTITSSLSREHIACRRLFIQSRPSPLPIFLSTTLVSAAGRERHFPFRTDCALSFHPLLSSFIFLILPVFPNSRLPGKFTAPSAMPTSSCAHARVLQTAPGMPAPKQPHPAAASSARS